MATKVIQMMEKTVEGYDMLIPAGGGVVIRVTSSAGTTVTCSLNGRRQSYTFSSNEAHDFYGVGYGEYTFTVTGMGITRTETLNVTESKIYELSLRPAHSVLNENSWAIISTVSEAGMAQNMWSLGDIKMVTIKGTITGTTFNDSYGVFIASFSHNPTVEGSGILFHSFKNNLTEKKDIALWANFQMNTTGNTNGGWRNCYMRNTIIPQFENAISTDLKNVVKTSTIYSHNYTGGSQNNNASYVTTTQDKFYLLAEFEIFGTKSYANSYERNHQVQVEYYKLGNSRIKYQSINPSSANWWWERSVNCEHTNAYYFCAVSNRPEARHNDANTSYGFAVAFRV